jgi:hypothetical protein
MSLPVMARLVVWTGDKPDVRSETYLTVTIPAHTATGGPDEPGHDGGVVAPT